MGKKEKISAVLELMGGNRDNVEKVVAEMDDLFETLNAEVEDWKLSMEEFPEGTRIYARFQVLLRK